MLRPFVVAIVCLTPACTTLFGDRNPGGEDETPDATHSGGTSGSNATGLEGGASTANGAAPGHGGTGGAASGSGGTNGGGKPGSGGGAGLDSSQPAGPQFTCNSANGSAELPFPRLSRAQLQNTLKFAIRSALPADADRIWNSVSTRFAEYPVDQRTAAPGDLKGGYSRFDQSIQLAQVQAMYGLGIEIARELTSTTARLTSLLGACATDASTANDRACLETFLRRWAARVMRTELSSEDVAFYADIAGTTPVAAVAVADVVAAVLNAPETLYRVEHGTGTSSPSPLSSFELAARLSFNLWQEPPDDELWAAASNGSLLQASTYESQLARLVSDPKLRRSLDEWVSEWLRLGELPQLDTLKDDPAFAAFAGSDLPTQSTRQAMIDDVLESAWSTTRSGQPASALLADRHAYAKDPILARIYGVTQWDGVGEAPLFPSPNRSGLLTRAALLATGTAGTRPIHKGYLVRNALLCQQLGAPPLNANTEVPVATGQLTTREAVSNRTSPASCTGCHSIINPAGFITEKFDALGRERDAERLFDARGQLIAALALDTAAAPGVIPGDTRVMRSAPELTEAIDTSRLFHSCVARHYFRFASARVEDTERDGCLLAKLEEVARSGASLKALLQAFAQDPTFKNKRFE
ncbi:MAG TPA: DUF1592 domain-containing protein [Polyangiaceae bacterium]|nr:DUF1592 domain-containing protein [Polyangiaceae bacterium]